MDTAKFLAGIGGSLTAVVSMGAVIKGVVDAIGRGGALADLSARTGETVGNLYQLQEAFRDALGDASGLGSMLFKLQQAMGGINEMGESTEKVFKAMGLSVQELRSKSGPEQLKAIFGALNQMGQSDAAQAAAKIFGRGGAQEALQIARQSDSFAATIADSANEAKVWERVAAAFDRLGDTWERLKSQVQTFFAGVAEGIQPALQALLDMARGVNWAGLGQQVGDVFRVLAEAFREGRIAELLTATFEAAISQAAQFMAVSFGAVITRLPGIMIEGFITNMRTIGDAIMASVAYGMGSVNERLGRKNDAARLYGEAAELSRNALDRNAKFYAKAIGEAMKAGAASLGSLDKTDAWRRMEALYAELLGAAPRLGASPLMAGGRPGFDSMFSGKKDYQPEANSLERVGAIFARGVGVGGDWNRATAVNTERTWKALDRIENAFSKMGMIAHLA